MTKGNESPEVLQEVAAVTGGVAESVEVDGVSVGDIPDSAIAELQFLRERTGPARTRGLPDAVVSYFRSAYPDLEWALTRAKRTYQKLSEDHKTLLENHDERSAAAALQQGFLNFYPADCASPYVPLIARGPWIVSAYGAVIYDTGGYGMLGFGHNPDFVTKALAAPQVMANVMTPQFSHQRFVDAMKAAIRPGQQCPYDKVVCMNSGSEAMSVAARISDVNAGHLTAPGGRYEGYKVKFLAAKGGFHGRTGRPSHASDSSARKYKVMASYRDADVLWTIPPNDTEALKAAFARAEKEKVFIECVFLEPVMGEGNPGLAVTPEFYREARALTLQSDSMLVVDSIQAGLRAQGVLSIIDYPGFEKEEAPDMESFSKALNAGQFPMSTLGLTKRAAECYAPGIYGNTMTGNARALDIATAVLERCSRELTENVRTQGHRFVSELQALQAKHPHLVTKVQGTGLLISIEFIDSIKVYGEDSLEEMMREHGVNVIHGGKNSLRYTPRFEITDAEIGLVVEATEAALIEYLDRFGADPAELVQ